MRARWLWIGLLAVASTAAAEPWKNLQVLPKDIPKERLKEVMKAQAKALGVDCDHCHDVPDMASDAIEHKKIAREMMRMTAEINARWLKPLKDSEKHPVSCTTCHRGKIVPEK
jgi:hypothetical protein